MDYSYLNRFFLCFFILATLCAFIFQTLIFLNFNIDNSKYNIDKIGLTRLSKNVHFSLCTVYDCNETYIYSLIMNIIILSIMFFQEALISNKDMVKIFIKRANGDLIYYPKIFSKFLSCFILSMAHMLYQPMNFSHLDIYPKLDLDEYIRAIWFLLPITYSLYLIFSSIYFNLYLNDELNIFLFMQLITGKDIPMPSEYLYGEGIYYKVRSPFRAGMMVLLFSLNTKWDLGRIIYFSLFCLCMYIEGVGDDRYFFSKESYKKYLQNVPNRFYNFNFLENKPNIDININKDNKEKEKKT